MSSSLQVGAIDLNRRSSGSREPPVPKNLKKCLAMARGIGRNGVIRRVLEGNMRNFKKFRPMRSRTFRSLLLVAGVFLFTAALAPRANAQNVLVYFNFEDNPIGPGYDNQADVQGAPD